MSRIMQQQEGAVLITLIMVITVVAFLSLGVLSLTTSALYTDVNTNSFHLAGYMAESGIRFAQNRLSETGNTFPPLSYYQQGGSGAINQVASDPIPRIETSGFSVSVTDCYIRAVGIVREDSPFESKRVIVRTDREWFRPYCAGYQAVAYYPFSGNAKDRSKDTLYYDGNLEGVTAVAGRRGCPNQGYLFRGDDAIGAQQKPVTGYPFTLAAWIKVPTTAVNDGVIVSLTARSDPTVQFGVYVKVSGGWNGRAFLRAKNSAGDSLNDSSLMPQTELRDGTWHLVAAVFRSSTVRALFVDGVKYALQAPLVSIPFDSQVNQWYIGRWGNQTPDNYFTGEMDEVAIFDYALTDDEILTYYQES